MDQASSPPGGHEGSTEIAVPKGQRTRYRVSGMDCASCAAKIETPCGGRPGSSR